MGYLEWIGQKEAILEALYLIFIDPINKDHQDDDEDENNTFFTVSMWDELVLSPLPHEATKLRISVINFQ